jgi:hypothetical protein
MAEDQMKKILTITMVLLLAAASAFAQNKFEASLEMNRVYVGNPVYLYLKFAGSSNVRQPEVPAVDGLKIKSVGSSTEMSVVNGVVSQALTYTYLVIPVKGGSYDIGPFFTDHNGQTYQANAVRLVVDQAPSSSSRAQAATPSSGASTAPVSAPTSSSFSSSGRAGGMAYEGDDIFLVMDVGKRTLYINEVVPVTIKLYVEGVGLKDIEYPVYSHEGFSAGEFLKPERRRENYRGSTYDTLEFRQDLFGIKEGDYVLGPARLSCKMISRKRTSSRRTSIFGVSVFMDDPFTSGFETYPIVLESKEIPVNILPFPDKGKPLDFQGAVGAFSFEVSVRPEEVKVGDPVTLTMTIGGYGNLDTVTAPVVTDSDMFKVYEPEVSRKGNKKSYEQILIPKNKDVKEVPRVSFSYFDPIKRKYETVTRGPFPIKVLAQPESQQPVKMVAMPLGEHVFYPKEELGQDIIYIKDRIGTLRPEGDIISGKFIFWVLQLVPVAAFGIFYALYRKRKRIQTDRGYARLLKAPRKARSGISRAGAFLERGDIPKFYDTVHKTLEEYLGNKFNLPKGSVTIQDIEAKLCSSGCDDEVLKKLHDVFASCEMARYASSVAGTDDHKRVLDDVRTIIDYTEKIRV